MRLSDIFESNLFVLERFINSFYSASKLTVLQYGRSFVATFCPLEIQVLHFHKVAHAKTVIEHF